MGAESATAAELAALAVPGFPSTGRGIRRLAVRDRWIHVAESGRGGDRAAYLVSSLPPELATALAARRVEPAPAVEPPRVEVDLDQVPERMRRRATERLRVVWAIAEALERGASARSAMTSVGATTSAKRWWAACKDRPRGEWLAALVPGYRTTARVAECHPQAWAYFRDLCLTASKMPEAEAYRKTLVVADAHGWLPVPSIYAMRSRLVREVSPEERMLRREGPKRLAAMFPAQERDRSVFTAMQALCADGHRFDVRVRWPDGTVERPILLAWQDLYSGLIVGWRVDRTENTDLVRLSLADVVRTYGIPELAFLDNGRAFASKLMTGGTTTRFRGKVRPEDPTGILTGLGVQVRWATPEHGQAKPIERAFGDLTNSISKHPAFDGAYLGRSPLHKPHNYKEGRAVDLADFLRVVDVEVRGHNARPGRRALVCAGRSFDETFRASYEVAPIRKATETQLRTLLLAADSVHVRRTGDIYFGQNRFWAPALAMHAGSTVTIRFDPDRLHEGIHVYRQDGSHLAFAECLERVGFADMAAARAHARAKSAFIKAAKVVTKAGTTFRPDELAALHLAASGAPPSPPSAKVVSPRFGAQPEPVPLKPTREERDRERAAAELVTEIGKGLLEHLPRRRTAQ